MRAVKGARFARVGVLAVALALTAACNPFSSSTKGSPGPTVTTTTTHRTHSGPHVIVKGHRTLHIGQVAQIGLPSQNAAALFRVNKPRVSTTALSKSYGYAPAHGYYVNFPIKIYNIGNRPLIINRLDFYVEIAGQGKVNNNTPNAPYSGASRQLDTTELEKGQGVSNFLAFDVRTPHGIFYYAPNGKISIAWRF